MTARTTPEYPRLLVAPQHCEVAPDPFDTLLTPSRCAWATIVMSEISDIVRHPGLTDEQKEQELYRLMEREQKRGAVAEER